MTFLLGSLKKASSSDVLDFCCKTAHSKHKIISVFVALGDQKALLLSCSAANLFSLDIQCTGLVDIVTNIRDTTHIKKTEMISFALVECMDSSCWMSTCFFEYVFLSVCGVSNFFMMTADASSSLQRSL